jgi:hypothetical protein
VTANTFTVCHSQASKRDSTTRRKATSALLELMQASGSACIYVVYVATVLEFWSLRCSSLFFISAAGQR